MSSNLLNLKFMQRGRDAEVAAKLRQQQVKEVSDQQWHLSVIQNLDSLPGRTAVSYEPSYSHFDNNANQANPATNMGRKIFGTFVPDIDDLIKSANDEENEKAGEASDTTPTDNTKLPKSDTQRPTKRTRGEDTVSSIRNHKKIKKKKQVDI